ncbi:MAG: PcfJ domain-containing protein [Methylococcaceae bacterium]
MDIQEVSAHEMQTFLRDREEAFYFVRILGKQSSTLENERISIRSCIQFLELYSAELITPFVSNSSEFPDFESASDWICSVKPHLDNNQVKRGWAFIEKSSEEWHQGNCDEIAEDISKLPDWKCSLKDQHEEWLNVFPSDNPYKIVPLTTPKQLHAESQTMRHCVVSYIHSCIAGGTRIFSVLDASNNKPVATAELSNHYGRWNLVQLKGKYNEELIHRTRVTSDPLAIALGILVNWYNKKSHKRSNLVTNYLAHRR